MRERNGTERKIMRGRESESESARARERERERVGENYLDLESPLKEAIPTN